MKLNQAGINLIKSFEGCKLSSYLCPAGKWTIGYGATFYENGNQVKQGERISQEQAENLLKFHLTGFERGVKLLLLNRISENAFSALVSFAFNCGVGALQKSTLLKMLNSGDDFESVAPQFLRWNKAGGVALPGLTRRREAEANLFLK
jgi:lysozyme